jgi:hypothetical protein
MSVTKPMIQNGINRDDLDGRSNGEFQPKHHADFRAAYMPL